MLLLISLPIFLSHEIDIIKFLIYDKFDNYDNYLKNLFKKKYKKNLFLVNKKINFFCYEYSRIPPYSNLKFIILSHLIRKKYINKIL